MLNVIAELEDNGLTVYRCFPNSFERVWALEGQDDSDLLAWEDYNIGVQVGEPPNFVVLLFPDYDALKTAIGLEPALAKLTTVYNPDGSVAVWCLERNGGGPNGHVAAWGCDVIRRGWIAPAPPSHVFGEPCRYIVKSYPLLQEIEIPESRPLVIKPYSLQAIPLRGLMAYRPQGQSMLVANGILDQGGKLVLAGVPKVGKSRLALYFAFALATGQPFLGFQTVGYPNILFLQFEISMRRFRDRVNSIARSLRIPSDNDLKLFFQTMPSLRLDQRRGIEMLRRLIQVTHAEVLFIDPLAKIHLGDENRAQEMQALFNILDDLIAETGIAIVVVHHFNKASESEDWARIRGSSYIPAWADSILLLERKGEDGYLQVRGILRNGEDFTRILSFNSNHSVELIGDTEDAIGIYVQQQVWKDPAISRKAIAARVAKAYGMDIVEAYSYLKKLEAKNITIPA